MTSEARLLKCRKCGAETTAESNFCNSCGTRIYDIEKLMAPQKFSIKLSFFSAIMTFVFVLLFSFFTAYFYTLYDQDIMSNPEKLIIISMIGPFIGIFTSALLTTYIFTMIRVREAFAGAAAVIILFKTSDFILASTFTIEGAGVALFSCFIALTGAYFGFFIKRKIKYRS